MDLVNIVYKYVNRFINSDKLIELLEEIDKTKFSKEEIKEIEKLLEEVKKVIKNTPIEIDEMEQKREKSLNNMLKKIEKAKKNDKNSKDAKEFIEKEYNNLLKEKSIKRDSGPKYEEINNLLINNSVYLRYCKNMSISKLLEFITQYICAPVVPNISDETFYNLVKIGIKEDKREALWRLAFNYNGKKKDFTPIADYFIEKRDDYYLVELISAVQSDLNLKKLVDKVMNTKDKNFIFGCGNRAKNLGIFTDEEIEKIKIRIKEEESSWK